MRVARVAGAEALRSASHFAESWSISTLCNGPSESARSRLTARAALNGRVLDITRSLVAVDALCAFSQPYTGADPGPASDDRNEIFDDRRPNGQGKALCEHLDRQPSPQLHQAFDAWLDSCVAEPLTSKLAHRSQPTLRYLRPQCACGQPLAYNDMK